MELQRGDIPSGYFNSTNWEKIKNKDLLVNKRSSLSNLNSNYSFSSDYATISDNTLLNNNTEEKLTHNNMQRFLKKCVTQNVNTDNYIADNNNYKFHREKEEVLKEDFFQPQKNLEIINGSTFNSNFYNNRIQNSLTQINNNVNPIEPIRVGPGLDNGFNNLGSGGFHDYNSQVYSKPRNIDDLRTKTNQKQRHFNVDYRAPAKSFEKRGVANSFDKNRPEKVYEQSEDNWFKTTGANLKQTNRSIENVKATNKQDSHVDYQGSIKYTDPGIGDDDNYGKENIIVYDNERQTTEQCNEISNLTSIVKAIVAPVIDGIKFTNKEYTINAARETGNIKGHVSKPTTYDPVNHVTKTTVKETTIHDSQNTNLTGAKETYSASQDDAKTTVKETTIHDSQNSNLTGAKETYSASQDTAKTTVKETTIHDAQISNIKGEKQNVYVEYDDKMKTTVKETTPNISNVRNIGNVKYVTYVYDPDSIVKTTVKETTIKGKSEFGFLGGLLNKLVGGYFNKNIELNNTNKQFTSEYSTIGHFSSINDHKQTNRDAYENAEIDDTREKILIAAAYTPNPGNMNVGLDSKNIKLDTNKNILDKSEYKTISKVYPSNNNYSELKSKITKTNHYDNAYKDRLDSNIMNSLKTNELNIQINPIV